MTGHDEASPWGRVAAALAGDRPGDDDGTAAQEPAGPSGWAAVGAALRPGGRGATAASATPDAPTGWASVGAALGRSTPTSAAGPGGAGGDGGVDAPGSAGGVAPGPRARALRRPGRGLLATRRRRLAAGALTVVVAAAVAVPLSLGGGGGLPSSDAFSVNGQRVSLGDFDAELQVRQTLYGITPPSQGDAARYHAYLTSAAQAEAVSTLLDQLAPREGVVVPTQAAEQTLAQAVQRQYGGSQTSFATALGAAGLNESQVLAEVQHNLVYQQLFSKVVGTPSVSQAQVQAWFGAHRAQLALPEVRDLSHIVVASQASAASVVAQLRGGASFAALAASSSLDTATAKTGGVLGRFSKADLKPAFASAAFAAPVGQPFGPVQDGSDWEVGEVAAVHPAAPATLDATTSAAIRTLLVDQAQADRWDAWLGGQLRAAKISYNPTYRPAHPDAPPVIPVPRLTGETLAGVGAAAPASAGAAGSGAAGGAGGTSPPGSGAAGG